MGDRIDEIWKMLTKIAKSSGMVEQKVDDLSNRLETFEDRYAQRLAGLEVAVGKGDERITILETKLGKYGWKAKIKANAPEISMASIIATVIMIGWYVFTSGILR